MNYLIDIIKKSFSIPLEKKYDYEIPDNLFGIFASIKRFNKIHGCIGNWNLKGLTKEQIIDIGFNVSYEAFWRDSRRKIFNKNINKESNSILEIFFMKLPIYEIDKISGNFIINNNTVIFDNNKYGIIIESYKKRATYLPEVFLNESFVDIKKSIIKKSGILNNNYKLYAYECYIYKTPINIIINKNILIKSITLFLNFISKQYIINNYIPYEILSNNEIVINKKEYVRNYSTIYEYLLFSIFLNLRIPENIFKIIIKNLLYDKNNINRHGKIYYHLIKYFLNNNVNFLNNNVNNLYYLLNKEYNKIEPNFELCQMLICIIIINPNKSILLKHFNILYKKLNNINTDSINSIFFINWFSKLFREMYVKKIFDLDYNIYEISNKIFNKIKIIYNNFPENIETNYLAVSFECLCAIYSINKYNDLMNYIFNLYIILEKRKKYGFLYSFLNKNCRIDITVHILCGFYYLLN